MFTTIKYTSSTTLYKVTYLFCICKNGYRFGFNGKEKYNETYGDGNAYDFGARIYDARIGRWLAVDSKSAKYPYLSPYVYVSNGPLLMVDPDGRDNIVYLVILPDAWEHLSIMQIQQVIDKANQT